MIRRQNGHMEGSFGAGVLKGRDRQSRILRVKESRGMCKKHI